jgi:hypothetical protein
MIEKWIKAIWILFHAGFVIGCVILAIIAFSFGTWEKAIYGFGALLLAAVVAWDWFRS